jgi:sugar O-acyltransferase (sialic acid O-acetyltransferase NeuD family)
MPTDLFNLVGAGGQSAVVIDALLATGIKPDVIQVWTQDKAGAGSTLLGFEIRHLVSPELLSGRAVHICIGDNAARQRVSCNLVAVGATLRTIAHPRATISSHAAIGPGSFLAAGSIVTARTRIGVGAIINHNAVVDHDCILGDFVHVAPGATLGGAVKLADLVLIGAGVNILPARKIGLGAVVGAGAVVTSDITAGSTYAGVPAAPLGKRRE